MSSNIRVIVLALLSGLAGNLGNLSLKGAAVFVSLYAVIAAGLIVVCIALLFYAYRLGGRVSVVAPLGVAGQVTILPVAGLCLNEAVTAYHWVGLLLMMLGTILIVGNSSDVRVDGPSA